MTKYLTIMLLALISISAKAQTTHQVSVSINQSVECSTPLALNESDLFNVFPNPVEFTFTIQSQIEEADISLIDLNGRNIRSKRMTNGEVEMEVSDLPKGIYIIHFVHGAGSDQIKIKIQ